MERRVNSRCIAAFTREHTMNRQIVIGMLLLVPLLLAQVGCPAKPPAVSTQPAKPAVSMPRDQRPVDDAIDRGIKYLYSTQLPDGSWAPYSTPDGKMEYPVGPTALAVWACWSPARTMKPQGSRRPSTGWPSTRPRRPTNLAFAATSGRSSSRRAAARRQQRSLAEQAQR